jgi:CO/xanthine dehydrogenase Mo-binding subunit
MVAHDTDVVLDGGAYAALKAHPLAVVPAIRAPVELYDVPNVDERCRCLYTNSLPGAHVRSPGEFQAAFAGESHVDVIARASGRDPIQFRLDNTGNPTLRRILDELRTKVDTWRGEARPGTGIGMALCFRDAGPGASTATCRVRADGTVEITVAVPDQGAGSYTVFRRLAADALGVADERVMIRAAGTDQGIPDSGAGASRVTNVGGRATVQACNAVVEALGGPPSEQERAGAEWIGDRLRALGRDEVEATGTWSMGWPPPPDADIRSYAGVAMEVSVDTDTGEFDIHRAFIVADTGVVVHAVAHRGQLEGGFVYGLSQATLEELVVEQGQVVTASLGDYRILSSADVPPLEVLVLEPDGDAFSGMRSVGELTNVGAAPALANAIHDAVGVRIRELPITPERIRGALRAAVGASNRPSSSGFSI